MALEIPLLTPTKIGVPIAPKVTDVLCTIKPTIIAERAGKPNAKSKGATIALGLPTPAATYNHDKNNQAITIIITHISDLIFAKIVLIINSTTKLYKKNN